ncbi:MAG TPA: HAD-IA family hydrolase [Anaerolineales bacterium]|nr:HAD-IA family hydrolase [Anaerolineales bacterium]
MANPGTISTLFLDIGGVLLTNGWDHTMRQDAAKKFNLDYEELNERHHLTFDTYEEGKLGLDEYLTRVIFHEERPFSRDEFRAFMFAQSEPYPDMIQLIRDLKDRYHLHVGAISNEGRELTVHRIEKFGLAEFMDFFVSSCFVHYRKPDGDMYRIALDISQAEPERSVYIEDRPMFVDVARGLGMKGIVHTGYRSTRQALEELGLSL